VAEDREVREKELRKVFREKKGSPRSREERFHSGLLDPEDTWHRSMQFGKIQEGTPEIGAREVRVCKSDHNR
jgi:hypothetical protein